MKSTNVTLLPSSLWLQLACFSSVNSYFLLTSIGFALGSLNPFIDVFKINQGWTTDACKWLCYWLCAEKDYWSTFLTTALTLGCSIAALTAGNLVSNLFSDFVVQIWQTEDDKTSEPRDDDRHRDVLVPVQRLLLRIWEVCVGSWSGLIHCICSKVHQWAFSFWDERLLWRCFTDGLLFRNSRTFFAGPCNSTRYLTRLLRKRLLESSLVTHRSYCYLPDIITPAVFQLRDALNSQGEQRVDPAYRLDAQALQWTRSCAEPCVGNPSQERRRGSRRTFHVGKPDWSCLQECNDSGLHDDGFPVVIRYQRFDFLLVYDIYYPR